MRVLCVLALLCCVSAFAREVPPLSGPVVDQARVLDESVRARIDTGLRQFKERTGIQMQVLVIPSLDDETLEGYSIKVVDQWKLGGKGTDKGLLFLIAMNEKRMRIEVGRGLEGDIPDATAGRIIELVKPYFREGRPGDGIVVGLRAIASSLNEKLDELPKRTQRSHSNVSGGRLLLYLLLFGAFFIFPLIMGGGRRFYGGGGGGYYGGGGGGFSSGGGSSWGGGGGGFSGGGASGGW